MHRYRRFVGWVRALAVAIIASVYPHALMGIDHVLTTPSDAVTRGLAVVGAVLAFKIIEGVALGLVDNSRTVRRLLLGRHFIEGWWVDVVKESESAPATSGAVFEIRWEEGSYVVEGESYGVDGDSFGEFHCDACEYDAKARRLRYAYTGINARHPGGRLDGYGEYRFKGDGPPNRIVGHITDSYHSDVTLFAERVEGPEDLRDIREPQTKARLVRDLARLGTDGEMERPRELLGAREQKMIDGSA